MVNDRVEFAVHTTPEDRDFESIKSLCVLTEELGYSIFTVTDHFQNMFNPDGKANHPLEAWTMLGGLASVTTKIKLGTLVSCVHYRHPTVLAKMATTLDIISGGRTIFGIGAGWHQKEFEGFLGEFPKTKKRLDGLEDALNIAKSMFVNECTTYKGKVYSAKDTMNLPPPVQQPIPIMVGGGGLNRTLKLAAKYADISHFAFISRSDDAVDQKIEALKEHCKAVGRDYSEVKKSITLLMNFNPTQSDLEDFAQKVAVSRGISFDEAIKMIDMDKLYPDLEETVRRIELYISKGINLFFSIFKTEEDAKLFAKVMKKI